MKLRALSTHLETSVPLISPPWFKADADGQLCWRLAWKAAPGSENCEAPLSGGGSTMIFGRTGRPAWSS